MQPSVIEPSKGGRVRVEPLGIEVDVGDEESLLEGAIRAGLRWPSICHGQGQCTVCLVTVAAGANNLSQPQRAEIERLRDSGRYRPECRLACQLRVKGPATVIKQGVRQGSSGDNP